MCLIIFAWRVHPRYPLVVAANRDEFFRRPTAAAKFWDDAPTVLAGKDIEAGGTWMGVTVDGRFAALTNFRDPAQMQNDRPSRGKLVADFLTGTESPGDYLARSAPYGRQCNGYNLLVGDGDSLWCSSNVNGETRALEPGIYGLSNHLLNSAWPKVGAGRAALESALTALPNDQKMFDLLVDATVHTDEALPQTGISLEWERLLSAAFIRMPPISPIYGTRSSTVLTVVDDGTIRYDEISWATDTSMARIASRNRYSIKGIPRSVC
ncbi:MAG: NRDE family protein [Rhodocyclaceae bacterium]|nr:NRDE family protein [Rhodocyclaceae bacterium]